MKFTSKIIFCSMVVAIFSSCTDSSSRVRPIAGENKKVEIPSSDDATVEEVKESDSISKRDIKTGKEVITQNQNSTIDLENLPFTFPLARDSRIDDDFVPFFEESEEALIDLSRVEREDRGDVAFTRYISLSFLDFLKFDSEEQRAGAKINLIDSMSVLLNSLSTDDFITQPLSINKSMNLFRIDIRDFNWTGDQWERLVTGANGANSNAYPYNNIFDPNVQSLQDKIGTEVPIIRADWMLFEGGKASNYHDLLQIGQNIANVENSVSVDRIENIVRTIDEPGRTPRAIRSFIGAGNSGVSTNNRVIERHESSDGAYWMSYDFLAVDGDISRDVLASPLGPNEVGSIDGLSGFQPAGGEVIFNLPNGLQAYVLIDEQGNRVNEAPTDIVFNGTDRLRGGEIQNGYVCWSCHSLGVLNSKDEMKPFLDSLDDRDRDELYSDDVVDALNAMHIPQNEMEALFQKDSEVHVRSITDSQILGENAIPQIALVAQYYEEDMSLDMVASELNLDLNQLERVLPQINAQLRVSLQAAKDGELNRQTFEIIFPELVNEIFDLVQAP